MTDPAAVQTFLDRLDGVEQTSKHEYRALCPAHDDVNPSLSITVTDDRLLIHCHAGCTYEQVVVALGLSSRDLFFGAAGVTLEDYAAAKAIPVAFLEGLGLATRKRNGLNRLRIPYSDEAGVEVAVRYRIALEGPKRFIWKTGDSPQLYALWLLDRGRQAGYVILVEGESDCHTLLFKGEPALGLPGANTWREEWCEHLDGIATVYVVHEPDSGGKTLLRRLADSAIASRVRVMSFPSEAKDPSALYLQNQDGFSAALEELKREAVPLAQMSLEESVRPFIQLDDRALRDICAPAVAELNRLNDPAESTPRLYRHGTQHAFLRDDDAALRLEPVDPDLLRALIDEACDFFRMTRWGPVRYPAPRDVAVNAMQLADWRLPRIVGVSEVPLLRPDGSILDVEGYDAATGLFYRPEPGLMVPAIPEVPSAAELATAREAVLEVYCDFPFTGPADRANAVGLALTPLVRSAIESCVPLALVTSAQHGIGKGLLARIPALVAFGREQPETTLPGTEEEVRKKLTAMLVRGDRYVFFDEVAQTIDSPALGEAITAPVWSDRRLGHTEMLEVPVQVTWVATGINLRVGRDFNRRVYLITLASKDSRPWLRTDFLHPELAPFVLEKRGELIAALLTMARAWWAAGQPKADSPVLGSFEAWCRTVGGILAHAGVEGFLGNLERIHEEMDEEATEWRRFLAAWLDHYALLAVTVADLIFDLEVYFKEVLPEAVADAMDPTRGSTRHRLGKVLRAHSGRPYGPDNLVLERGPNDPHLKVATWLVKQV
jgi:hypothetical protein